MKTNAIVCAPLREAEQRPESSPRRPEAHSKNSLPATLPASSPHLAHVLVSRQLPAVGWAQAEPERLGRPPLARNHWGSDFGVGPVVARRLAEGLFLPVILRARLLPG